ncbi:conserved hypothetical protein [Citreicella sp. SE45]|nr:conserved hypothetical protein [Citreicella sp. SE45]
MQINYRIENFKAFGDSGAIEFSPITVLCGVNSAGKSSIIKSILLAKQSSALRRSTLSSSSTEQPFILNGEFASLGSWSDTVTGKDKANSIRISWGVSVSDAEYRRALNRANIRPLPPSKSRKTRKVELSTSVSSDPSKPEELSLFTDSWELSVNQAKVKIVRSDKASDDGDPLYSVRIHNVHGLLDRGTSQIGRYGLYLGDTMKAVKAERGDLMMGHVKVTTTGPFAGSMRPEFDESWSAFFDAIPKIAVKHRGIKRGPQPKWINHLEAAARTYAKTVSGGEGSISRSPSLRAVFFLAVELLEEVSKAFNEAKATVAPMWRDVRYLGPLRDQPRRYYQFNDTGGADVGVSGEFTVQTLALERNNMLSACQVHRNTRQGIEFSDKVDDVFLAHVNHWLHFMGLPFVEPSTLEQSLYKLEVGDLGVGLLDVGFGVSQVLPVVVEALRANPGDLVILEQPEIHLHPRVQAKLADFLLARSLDGVRFLVESHSEYLIKRLCRRKAESEEGKWSNTVNIYFIEGRPGEAACNKVEVNEFGEIENWPTGFFDLDEDLYWTRASLKKRKSVKGKR